MATFLTALLISFGILFALYILEAFGKTILKVIGLIFASVIIGGAISDASSFLTPLGWQVATFVIIVSVCCGIAEQRQKQTEGRNFFAERLRRLSADAKRAANQLRYWDYYQLSRVQFEGSEKQREAARLEIERREQRPASVPYHLRWAPERRWMEPRPWVKALIGEPDED